MSYADNIFKNMCKDILENGTDTKGEKVRPHWSDGEQAYTIKKFGVINTYDLLKEFPAITLRKTIFDKCIDEMLWIFQTQSNNIKDLHSHTWDSWADKDGSIGKAYGYTINSRPENKLVKRIEKRYTSNIYCDINKIQDGDLSSIKNMTIEQIDKLRIMWQEIIDKYNENPNVHIDERWFVFENFIRDCRYMKQWYFAKDNLDNYIISRLYYNSNRYDKDSCVWLTKEDEEFYFNHEDIRYKLSSNQINDVISNLKTNPFNRRIMTNFWNYENIDEKSLVECAYSMTYNVTQDSNGDLVLNAILNQRSSDVLTANNWNVVQYATLVYMLAQVCGMKVGTFIHVIADCHIYDRHIPMIKELLSREPLDAPNLQLNPNIKDFYDFTLEDIKLENYNTHEQIKNIPVAI